jgi:hypothetical protein
MHVHQREWEIGIELKRFNLFIFQSEVRTEILHYTIYIYKDKNTDKEKNENIHSRSTELASVSSSV